MNLLEFAIQTQKEFDECEPKNFSKLYIKKHGEKWFPYHFGIITSLHGIDFFNNVIKYWDDPHSYYTPAIIPTNPLTEIIGDYEYNFVRLLLINKNSK